MNATHAIVRPPGTTYPSALTRQVPAAPVSLPLAQSQHAQYVQALRDCGLAITILLPDDAHPDAVFVQDPVVVIESAGGGGAAIVGRSAVPSRQGEAQSLVEVLAPRLPVVELAPPARLDGGDLLITDSRLYVGLSARSNLEACAQLARLTGLEVQGVPIPDSTLHLLSGCTYLGSNRLLVIPELAPLLPEFDTMIVPPEEAYAANILVVGMPAGGGHAIVPAGFPRAAALVEACGLRVHPVPVSEFEKRDGGVTCLSLLF